MGGALLLSTVADAGRNVKGPPEGLRDLGSDREGPSEAERRAAQAQRDRADEDLELRPPSAAFILAGARVNSPGGELPPSSHRFWQQDGPERRQVPRHSKIKLTPLERERLRSMLAKALGCGTRFVAVRRAVEDGPAVREERMVVATHCGTRVCRECDEKRRDREAFRVEGNWRQFHTLGVPASSREPAEAWRRMGEWASALFREIRREYAEGDGSKVRIADADLELVAELRARHPEKKRRLPDLQYAWCLEPHKSGWPHIHFVTNTSFVDFAWMRKTWGNIIGATVKWSKTVKVRDVKGVCRYLSKYISKTTFTTDIAAIMYRRRQWASTMPKVSAKKEVWEPETGEEWRDLFRETVEPERTARVEGWTIERATAGIYALWTRWWTKEGYEKYRIERLELRSRDDAEVLVYDRGYEQHAQRMRDRSRMAMARLFTAESAAVGADMAARKRVDEYHEAVIRLLKKEPGS